MDIPKKMEYGPHEGKIACPQYACLNNYGECKGIHYDGSLPYGCCMLKNPRFTAFNENTWGCSDERYGNEIEQK